MSDYQDEQQAQVADQELMAIERNKLLKTIDFGFEVEAFLKSPIGTYLCTTAEMQRVDTLELLGTVEPDDANAIRRLQTQLKVLDSWQSWLADAITTGRDAQKSLIEQG